MVGQATLGRPVVDDGVVAHLSGPAANRSDHFTADPVVSSSCGPGGGVEGFQEPVLWIVRGVAVDHRVPGALAHMLQMIGRSLGP